MKQLRTLLSMLLAFTESSLGQRLNNFINYSVDGSVNGQVAEGSGGLAGPEWLGQLYAAPPGGTLQPIGIPVPFIANGILSGGTVEVLEVPFIAAGAQADVQRRAWLAAYGASYEEAVANPSNPSESEGPQAQGESNVITITLGGGVTPPASLTGLQPTQMYLVPEPPAWAPIILGFGALALGHRR